MTVCEKSVNVNSDVRLRNTNHTYRENIDVQRTCHVEYMEGTYLKFTEAILMNISSILLSNASYL